MKIPTSRIDGHRDRLHSYGLHRNGYDEEHTVASGRGLFMVSVQKSPVPKVAVNAVVDTAVNAAVDRQLMRRLT